MAEPETLRTLAEVGIALAGFTGIIAVLGRRARGDWTPVELARMRLLLEASLGVVFFALVPVLLPMAVPSHQLLPLRDENPSAHPLRTASRQSQA